MLVLVFAGEVVKEKRNDQLHLETVEILEDDMPLSESGRIMIQWYQRHT